MHSCTCTVLDRTTISDEHRISRPKAAGPRGDAPASRAALQTRPRCSLPAAFETSGAGTWGGMPSITKRKQQQQWSLPTHRRPQGSGYTQPTNPPVLHAGVLTKLEDNSLDRNLWQPRRGGGGEGVSVG